jgi:aconitase A
VRAVSDDGAEKKFSVVVRVDTPQEVEYYRVAAFSRTC